jgi:hypothetical protein
MATLISCHLGVALLVHVRYTSGMTETATPRTMSLTYVTGDGVERVLTLTAASAAEAAGKARSWYGDDVTIATITEGDTTYMTW